MMVIVGFVSVCDGDKLFLWLLIRRAGSQKRDGEPV